MTNKWNIKEGQPLPDDHSVVRLCSPRCVERDNKTRQVMGVFPAAWKLRAEEDYLSVNWLEYFFQTSEDQAIQDCIEQFKQNLDVRKNSAFAVCGVVDLKEVCLTKNNTIKIVLMPEPNNGSHSAIKRIKSEDDDLLAEISVRAVRKVVDNAAL